MKKILLICFILCSALITESWAQGRTVSGKVISSDDTEGLPGVNVVIKGTTSGTVTDIEGMYKIDVTSDEAVLVFSSIGFITQELAVGTRSVIDITLAADVQQLSEVVVTALGIEREARELGYSISGVDSEDLVVARETNVVNALQGKVTGVNITNTSGNLGASSKITVRGVSSLSGRNNPLWVIDGVPINNNQTASGSRITGNRDFANGASVINPDDVESINVLKGAAATALYGSRAAAGVIVVTTKKGKAGAGGGPSVEINSSIRFDELFKEPDFQNQYAGGEFMKYDSSATFSNFGARIVGQTVSKAITGERVPLQAFNDNINDFFETGTTLINNFAVSDAHERGDYRLSLTSLNQTGVLPGASLDRLTATFNAGFKHSDKFRSRFSAQYIRTTSEGTGVSGANDPNVIGLSAFVRTIDFRDYQPWIDASGNQINTVGTEDNNPFWIQNENRNDREDDRFLGNFETTFTPIENLNLTARVGYDLDVDERLITNRVGTIQRFTGTFRNDVIQRTQLNIDAIATYFWNINEDFTLDVLGGWNYNRRVFELDRIDGEDFVVPEIFAPGNTLTSASDRDYTEQKLFGVYGQAVMSYKDWLTLTLTARNDWSSTLPLDNNSYFYPSASVAWVFTDALDISGNVLSYAKFRASIAQVGNDAGAYQLLFRFFPRTVATGQYSLNLNFPFQGQSGYDKTNVIPNQELVPEEQTSYEFGLDMQFFDGRLGLDLAYFSSENKNQILNVPIPESTGFGFKTVNVGQVTQEGVEVTLNAGIIQTDGGFNWDATVNFSHVESTVDELTEGTDRVIIASAFNSVQLVAVPGKEFQLFGVPWEREETTGRPVINENDGTRVPGVAKEYGSVFPDFTMGTTNTFSYRGFALNVTVDWSNGGLLRSATVENMWTGGFTEETLRNREGTFIDTEGVIINDDGSIRENDVPLRSAVDFWQSLDDNSISEPTIFDASYVKLREVGLFYTLPSSLFTNSFIGGIQVGVEGRNLALLYSKVPHIDPEASLFGAGADGFGIERSGVPSTRGFGFNLRATF